MSRPDFKEKGRNTVPPVIENKLHKEMASIPLLHTLTEENDATHRTGVCATAKGGER